MSLNSPTRDIFRPRLTEVGVKMFLHESLKQCREFKIKYNNAMINTMLFVGLVSSIAGVLLYKYKGKLTQSELLHKSSEKKQYVLSKIRIYNENTQKARQELITGLPDMTMPAAKF